MASKRTASETDVPAGSVSRPSRRGENTTPKRVRDEMAPAVVSDDEEEGMGEFEDEYEDEFESEEEVVDAGEDEDDEADDSKMAVDGMEEIAQERIGNVRIQGPLVDDEDDEDSKPVDVFLPGKHELAEDEELVMDASAYEMLHALSMEWPCLSFDVLRDKLPDERTSYPMTAYVVTGTQADVPMNNKLVVMKMSQLARTQRDDGDDSDDDSDDDVDADPVLEHRWIRHAGGVNRVRAMPGPSPSVVATWSDLGRVFLFDISNMMAQLETPGTPPNPPTGPLHTFAGHATEGFAMDWSERTPGRLLTGDCAKYIYLWNMNGQSSWTVDKQPFLGHQQSVEDIQWSPTEKEVFASCSVDKTIKVWDCRRRKTAALSVKAHDSDVNVISWNRVSTHLMVSGGDDGVFCVWDLRNFKSGQPAAQFKWHTKPITSVEWHPSDESVIGVAGADNQITIWDLSVEDDTEASDAAATDQPDVPPQLLFIHQGQDDIKELHWHKQMPGVMLSTAFSGFNIFKTISV